jgi:hypothetical protein
MRVAPVLNSSRNNIVLLFLQKVKQRDAGHLAGVLVLGKENAPTVSGTCLLMVRGWQFHGLVIWEWCAE